jgi:hypothetical protein
MKNDRLRLLNQTSYKLSQTNEILSIDSSKLGIKSPPALPLLEFSIEEEDDTTVGITVERRIKSYVTRISSQRSKKAMWNSTVPKLQRRTMQ